VSLRSVLWSGWYGPAAFLLSGLYLLGAAGSGGRGSREGFPSHVAVGAGWLYVALGVAGLILAAIVH
jgi:hypothetical protein